MEYRYENIRLKFMREITVENNIDGQAIIYVQKCDKFEKRGWKIRKI